MSGLLRAVLPDLADLASAELYDDPPHLAALPEEQALIARSVDSRQREFVTARHCARVAMAQLGAPPSPILRGERGQPLWPRGLVGSLTHCAGYRGAVVGRSGAVRAVGIDAEPHAPLPDGVLDTISLPGERDAMAALPRGAHWDRILFCAKEATYKTWFPLTHRWLGFEDAEVNLRVGPEGTTGGFVSRILIDPAARSGAPLAELAGRWSVAGGVVVAAIVL